MEGHTYTDSDARLYIRTAIDASPYHAADFDVAAIADELCNAHDTWNMALVPVDAFWDAVQRNALQSAENGARDAIPAGATEGEPFEVIGQRHLAAQEVTIRTLREELEAAREELEAARDEYRAFRRLVAETALEVKQEEGWCSNGFYEAMQVLGLTEADGLPPRIRRIEISAFTVEVEADADGDVSEEAIDEAAIAYIKNELTSSGWEFDD